MPKCLECGTPLTNISNEHLIGCCGLTLQEYAIRHCLPLDILVPQDLINQPPNFADYEWMDAQPNRRTRLIVSAVEVAGNLRRNGEFAEVSGEVRRLEQLFWFAKQLRIYKFVFKQEYQFNSKTHRVVAQNCLRTRLANLQDHFISVASLSPIELLLYTSVVASLNSFMSRGYLFLPLADAQQGRMLADRLAQEFKIQFKTLDSLDNHSKILLRTETLDHSYGLINLLKHQLEEIPCAIEHLYPTTPIASVTKELSFDSAHFITDHPGACSNMHGGRYNLMVTVCDHIDVYTGFVMDYAYLKAVVKERVIKSLDHANINLADSSLSWRSSTELLSIFIWQRLIDYIPSLEELNVYETENSHCTYVGPSLEEWQGSGCILPSHFDDPQLGRSVLRRQSGLSSCPVRLTSVGGKKQ